MQLFRRLGFGYCWACQVLLKIALSTMFLGCVGLLLGDPAWAHGVDPNTAGAVAARTSLSSVWERGTDASPVWSGAMHVLTSPLALAALLGLVAALFGIEERLSFGVAVITATSAAMMALLTILLTSYLADLTSADPVSVGLAQAIRASFGLYSISFLAVLWANFSQALAPVGVACIGLIALIGWRHTRTAAISLGLLAGGVVGLAAQLDNGYWQSVLGLMTCTAFIAACGLITFRWLKRLTHLQPILPIARRVLGSWVVALGLLLAVLAVRNGLNGLGWLK